MAAAAAFPAEDRGEAAPLNPPNWGEVAAPESAAEVTSKASPSWGRLEGAVSAPRVLSPPLSLLPSFSARLCALCASPKSFTNLLQSGLSKTLSQPQLEIILMPAGECVFLGGEAFFSETALFSRLNGSFSAGNGTVFLRKRMPFFCQVTLPENSRCPYSYLPTADFCPPTSDSFQKTAPFLGEP